ncbi:class I SAM-dependent methyltransferase [Gammaproteobacteria bacterium]|nr:class I SAM-dependent methyltransferase [Gammaproteobacteria bacterium]
MKKPDIRSFQNQNTENWALIFDEKHLIRTPSWQFHVDYRSLSFNHIQQNPFNKIFKNTPKHMRICDASAGLGRDSYLITELGFQVDSIEQHPVLFTLMQEGHEKCLRKKEIWHLHHDQCENLIGDIISPDIIYFDPMFEKKIKLSQKYTQVLQHYAESATDKTMDTFNFLYNYCQANGLRLLMKQPQKSKSHFPKAHHRFQTSRNCECWIYQF